MGRIAIYIGRHLCTAPRPLKEADALAIAGHEVSIYGLWSDARLVARDRELLRNRAWRFEPYADCRGETRWGALRWLSLRANQRWARELFRRFGRTSPELFGYGTSRLLDHARHTAWDLAIFHSEAGLWAGSVLHRMGRRVGMDFEDWFSQDLAPDQRAGRPIATLSQLEAQALHFGPYVLSTSKAMATALANAYGGPTPAVIYNCFPRAEAPGTHAAVDSARVRLHWFSQTVGPHRGLEALFGSLAYLPPNWELNLIGDDAHGHAEKLLALIPAALHQRVTFAPTVPNAKLAERIADNDIGLALDVSEIVNRNVTITNKLFQYMQAGLAIVASDTAGHREILDQVPEAGTIFQSQSPGELTHAITTLLTDIKRLQVAKLAAKRAALGPFAHENQIPRYAELAQKALSGT